MLNLPLLSVGAVGFVSVVGHVVTPELRALIEAHLGGDVQKATEIHQKLLPVFTGMFRTQGVITTKAALTLQGLPMRPAAPPSGGTHRPGDGPAQDRSGCRWGTALTTDFTTEYARTLAAETPPDNSKCTNDMRATCPQRYVARVVRRVF